MNGRKLPELVFEQSPLPRCGDLKSVQLDEDDIAWLDLYAAELLKTFAAEFGARESASHK